MRKFLFLLIFIFSVSTASNVLATGAWQSCSGTGPVGSVASVCQDLTKKYGENYEFSHTEVQDDITTTCYAKYKNADGTYGSGSPDMVGGACKTARPDGSVRKQDYPTRVRAETYNNLENNATDSSGVIKCQNSDCKTPGGEVLAPGKGTVEHIPSVVKTHNEKGYDTNQKTRNDLYNETAKELHCKSCQAAQGGATKEKYRRDVGPNYEPKPKKIKTTSTESKND